jgi:regulator of sigma E protease
MQMFLSIVSFFLLLGVLMFFHELGHYLVARRNGIEVEEFGVFGFPPRLIKLFTYDGTLFSINAIPFGAFVRMKGEDMADTSPGSFNAARGRGRVLTLLAGPAMNLLLAVFFSIAGVFSGFPAGAGHPHLSDLPPDTELMGAALEPNDTLIRLNGRPVYIDARSGELLNPKRRNPPIVAEAGTVVILRDGALHTMQVPFATRNDLERLLAENSPEGALLTKITQIAPGSPAEKAGLLPGDLFYAVNGQVVSAEHSLGDMVRAHLGETITVTLLRGDELYSGQVLARQEPPPGQGAIGVGISGVLMLVTLPFFDSIWLGIASILDYIQAVVALPMMLIAGQLAPQDAALSGPVGIAQLVGGAVNATVDTGLWFPVWQLAAIISAGLAVANLLPIPALDGGRLLFILIEKLRGRRIAPEKEGVIHLVGFILLLGLMVVITINDIRSGPQGIDWFHLLGQ